MTALMEMSFPHKSLTQTSADTDVSARSAYEVLIAHAIARQSLSPSARAYIARQRGLVASPIHASRGMMENRIKLFADASSQEGLSGNGEHGTEKGSFRPDLLRENPSGRRAQD